MATPMQPPVDESGPPFPGAAAPPGRHLAAGPYRLERQLGSGGESHVWLATHVTRHTPAVIKVQRIEVRSERLRRETAILHALQAVRTPNVVKLFPADHDGVLRPRPGAMRNWNGDEVSFCAMEPLPSDSGANLIKQGPLKRPDVLAVCVALCQTFRLMHLEFEMIHNDLKPDNIVAWREPRDGRLQVRLLDFGQAALLMPQPGHSQPCVLPEPSLRYVYDYGSRPYKAPERWHGQLIQDPDSRSSPMAAVDDRADQWAFAATVFRLLTGRTLVEGRTEEQFRAATIGGAYFAAIDEARIPLGARVALRRALALKPADRYQRVAGVSGLEFFYRDLEMALT